MNIVNNWLNKHYYFNNDGKPDEIADSLGDCMIQTAANGFPAQTPLLFEAGIHFL